MKLFHCSPTHNRASILGRGLVPSWHWDSVSKSYEHEPVHLAEEADPDFINDLHEVDEVDIYEVDTAMLTLHPGHDGPGTFAVFEWIPQKSITWTGTQKASQ